MVLASVLVSGAALAQEAPKAPQCMAREQVTNQMIRGGGSPVVVAKSGQSLLEVWSDGEQWVAFQTRKDGTMCPMASGTGPVHTAKQLCVDPVRCPRV